MSKDSAAQSGEERLIARYFAPLAQHPGAFGLADDAAGIAPPAGWGLVLQSEGGRRGVGFFSGGPPASGVRKGLRRGCSAAEGHGREAPRTCALPLSH